MTVRAGIGLPNAVRGVRGDVLVEWARRAEAAGFSSLATLDRLVFPSQEPLVVLAASAAVTERIGLFTNVLLGTLRPAALLAKEALTLDEVSGGRLTLGLGVGGRADDFEAAGVPMRERGRRMDELLVTLRRAAAGELGIGPAPVRPGGPPLMIGGSTDAAIRRVVEHGAGWTAGGGGAARAGEFAERVRAAWRSAGREGSPRLAALVYFALGPDPDAQARAYLGDYYAFLGDRVEQLVQGAARSAEQVRELLAAFDAIGFDEVVFDPTSADLEEIERLAAAVGG